MWLRQPRSSASLLRQARSDADAFAAVYDAHAQRILVFHARRVLDAQIALDLMSETFARAWERRRQFRGSTLEEEKAWLFAIARSQLSDYWRRGRAEREALGRLGVDVPALTDESIERIEELAEVRQIASGLDEALERLPPDQVSAVRLRILDERSYDDIAAELAVSPQVARARVSRGLRALATSLSVEVADGS